MPTIPASSDDSSDSTKHSPSASPADSPRVECHPDDALLPNEVLLDEHAQLRRRRENCFPKGHPHIVDTIGSGVATATSGAAAKLHGKYRSTVGLALSGGGIRMGRLALALG